jgi:hypothetical protein
MSRSMVSEVCSGPRQMGEMHWGWPCKVPDFTKGFSIIQGCCAPVISSWIRTPRHNQ